MPEFGSAGCACDLAGRVVSVGGIRGECRCSGGVFFFRFDWFGSLVIREVGAIHLAAAVGSSGCARAC